MGDKLAQEGESLIVGGGRFVSKVFEDVNGSHHSTPEAIRAQESVRLGLQLCRTQHPI